MESIIRDKIMEYFLLNNLFSPAQYGFIKGRSTMLQLLKIVDNITTSLDSGGQVDIIYTDFEKAFDKVPHKRLLSKLKSYGICKKLINWIEAFLCFRTQCVKINGVFSDIKPVLSGIPQGSVLGPVLFVIFINDMPDVCKYLSEVFLFADDSKLYKHINDNTDYLCLKQSCQNVYDWSNEWCMKLNIDKCKVLTIIKNKNKAQNLEYGFRTDLHGFVALDHVDSIKDLGVIVDCNLNFSDHIYEKIKKAYQMIGIIKRNFKNIDKNTFILLYTSLIRSHLEYANSVWNPYKSGFIADLEKVQKRATKLIWSCKSMHYSERLRYLGLPTLKYRRLRGDMIETFKILNGFYDLNTVPVLTLNINTRTRGNSLKLKHNRCRYDINKFSFCHRVVGVWNSLPNNVILSCSINSFKNNLDKHWHNEDILYNWEASLTGGLA